MHDSDGLSGFQLFGELTQYPSIRREVSQRHMTCHVTGGGCVLRVKELPNKRHVNRGLSADQEAPPVSY